jgi:hypothetical protein
MTPFELYRLVSFNSVLVRGSLRYRSPYLSVPLVFKTRLIARLIKLPYDLSQGFEPRSLGPKPRVLPLDEERI